MREFRTYRSVRGVPAELALLAQVALLRKEFFIDARRDAHTLLSFPDISLGGETTLIALHRWAGVGGSIGLAELSALAREAEHHAAKPPVFGGL
jgi:hypothetical protein